IGKDEIIIGRKNAVSDIVTTLTSSDINQENLSVMAIAGMPGLGKTTLAKSVYNDNSVTGYFEKRIWVCVSDPFNINVILICMLESLNPSKATVRENQDAMLKYIEEELREKIYLLVLDDVWNEESEKWERLMSCLSKLNSAPGSKIIVTTRSGIVAPLTETLPRPKLDLLSTDECWSILKHAACSDGSLERIGREIAKKCEGLPLMAQPILSLDNLKCVGEEIYGNDVFPSLKELCIRNCKELIEWMEAPKQVMVFPCLEKLDIENCPKLRKVPSHFPSMKNLMIEGNEELTCVPEGMLLKIEGMDIMDCEKLTCIAPDVFGCCASIGNLVVNKCPSLQSISDLHNFTSLRELSIGNCKRLESLVNNGLVSVVELLRIRDCNGLQSIPVLNLFTSLHKLSIENCERLESLVSSGSVSVVDLNIIKCSGLQSIPALNLFTSLRELSIEYCRRLESLL
ncbi:PREDICTED: disease resistance protein RGA2-like, partial [Prunus mume]|uniref:Disease resistance protein RGA2-like n=1 Tax=Prunus mume TaxID=102107 RepID=A0ABM0PWB2_PRUMU